MTNPEKRVTFPQQSEIIMDTPKHPPLAYRLRTAAELLDVSQQSVRRLIERGELQPVRVLRTLLIPACQLERLLSSNKP